MFETRTENGSLTYAQYDLLDSEAHIYRHKRSGDVWQFRMWIKNEQKDYRKSLKTREMLSPVFFVYAMAISPAAQSAPTARAPKYILPK